MYDGGVITREEIFSNEALTVGSEYAKNLEQAIRANKEFIESIKDLDKLSTSIRQVKSTSEYVKVMGEVVKVQKELNASEKESLSYQDKMIVASKKKAEQEEKAFEKKRLAQLKLDQQTEKSFDNYEKSLEKQTQLAEKKAKQDEKNAEKQRLDELRLGKQREKSFDDYEKSLQRQDELAKKKAEQDEKERIRLEKLKEPYKQLELALNNVRGQAKNLKAEMFYLEVQGKKNTQEYRNLEIASKAVTLQTNVLDKGIKDIDKSLGQHQREVGNYAIAADALNPIFGRINSQLSIFGTSIDSLANKKSPFKQLATDVMAFGKATLAFMLTPLGATLTILGALFALISSNKQTVIDFNSGLINIGKTTGLADEELIKLGDDIIGLSRKLKVVGTPALLEYATVAGQLGVKGTKNLLAFTEALAKLETASNIKGEEGGSDIARLLTITDGGVQTVKDFGDEIVILGNNFAATEKEILSNSTSIAQNVSVYKTGRQDILAYGTATKAVGIESELSGSKIGKAMKFLESSIRTGSNITEVMNLTGLSVEELKSQFKEDSGGVLFKFIEGLNLIDKAGGSVIGTLNELGIKEERHERVLSVLATGGFETLANAMDTVREANGSLDEEFEAASNKLELQWARIGIGWDNLVLSLENGQGIFAKTGGFIAGIFANYLEASTTYVNELSTAWNALRKTFGSTDTDSKKAEKSLFTLENVLTLIRFAVFSVAKTIGVELPNAYRTSKLGLDVLTNSFMKFAGFIKDVAPQIGPVIKDALNPLAKADTSGLSKSLKNFTSSLYASNKDLIDKTKNENKNALDAFIKNYADANKEIEDEKKKLENSRNIEGLDSETGLDKKTLKEAEKLRKKQEKEEDERIKKLKESYEKQINLEIFRVKRLSDISKELSVDEKLSMDERLSAFEKYHTDLLESKRLESEKELTLASNFNKDSKALTNDEIQGYISATESIEGLTDEQKLILEKWYAEKDKLNKDYLKSAGANAKKEADIIAKQTAGILLGVDKDKFDELKEVEKQFEKGLISKEEYEKRIAAISLKYTTKTFEEQIKGMKDLVDLTGYSEDEKLKIKAKIAEAEMNLIKAKNDYENELNEKSIQAQKKKLDIVRNSVGEFSSLFAEIFDIDGRIVEDFIMNLLDSTVKLEEKIKSTVLFIAEMTNAVYRQKIDEIDFEIEKTNEKYENEINLAKGNEQLQARLKIKQEAETEKLEAKKRKEQQKQLNANKAFAIAQTVWATAQAIMQAYAQLGPIGGTIAAVLVGTLGAIQINQIRSQEIPKYEFGTRGGKHKGGLAEVAEKRPEVVLEPNRDPYIIDKRGVYDLPKGTEVISSIDEYKRLQKASIMTSLASEKNDLDTYQLNMVFNNAYGSQTVDELKLMREDIKRLTSKKQSVNVRNDINIGNEIWKLGNVKW